MKVNRQTKVHMTCEEYIALKASEKRHVKMCHEWHEWDEFEGDEVEDDFQSAIGPEDDVSLSDTISSRDSFYSIYSGIEGDSVIEDTLRETLVPILPLGAKRCDQERSIGCYDQVDAASFSVRGPDYISTKKKISPTKSLFDLVSLDLLKQESFLTSQGSFDQVKYDGMVTELIDTRLGKNLMRKKNNGFVLHFFIIGNGGSGGWHAFIFFTRNVDVIDESFESQFNEFLTRGDAYRNERFKLLVADFETLSTAGWGVRLTAAGVRQLIPPAVILGKDPKINIVHRKLEPNEFHGTVLLSDIDLSQSGMVDRVKGILTDLKISLGITFECKDDHIDCPERLMGSFSFVGANIEGSLQDSEADLEEMRKVGREIDKK